MGSLVLKKLVEAGFARAVVRGGGHAETLVLVAQAAPGALQQGELCEHLEAGNVFLGLLRRKEGPNSADIVQSQVQANQRKAEEVLSQPPMPTWRP